MSRQENITRIKVVHDALGELAGSCVFVGGATVDLYSTRPAGEVRPTEDVDIIIELLHYTDYAAIEERLRQKGFANDAASVVICRYSIQGIVVDIMPTDSSILGFANQWYPAGFRESVNFEIETGYSIRILQPAYFVATKLEAFRDRGKADGRFSTDFEDIIYVLNTRPALFDEMETATEELRLFLKDQFRELLQKPYIDEWISAHLDYTEQRRVTYILGGLQNFVASS